MFERRGQCQTAGRMGYFACRAREVINQKLNVQHVLVLLTDLNDPGRRPHASRLAHAARLELQQPAGPGRPQLSLNAGPAVTLALPQRRGDGAPRLVRHAAPTGGARSQPQQGKSRPTDACSSCESNLQINDRSLMTCSVPMNFFVGPDIKSRMRMRASWEAHLLIRFIMSFLCAVTFLAGEIRNLIFKDVNQGTFLVVRVVVKDDAYMRFLPFSL